MKAIRHAAFGCLLAFGLWAAIAPQPRIERVHPDRQYIHPATPQESKRAELFRELGQR